jgi:hypothetical protein
MEPDALDRLVFTGGTIRLLAAADSVWIALLSLLGRSGHAVIFSVILWPHRMIIG